MASTPIYCYLSSVREEGGNTTQSSQVSLAQCWSCRGRCLSSSCSPVFVQVSSLLLELSWQVFEQFMQPSVSRRRRSLSAEHLSNNIDSLVEAIPDADIASSSVRHWNEVTSRRRRKRSTSDEDCDDHMMMGIQQLSELALALIESDVDYEMHPEITVSNTRAQSQLHVA